ncbi:helix-turn-helix domain-containing protein, partial [Enterococcus faecium]|nr:helix-turn-helix domain-containing protein [Enterococcus faecium]
MVDKSKKRQYLLVPLSIILSALEGDPISIKMILKHYHSYMAKLCLTSGFHEVGQFVTDLDEYRCSRLGIKTVSYTKHAVDC